MSERRDVEETSSIDSDALQLQKLGYKQTLHRSWHYLENFAASFCALNFIGGVRSIFFLGLLAGGPLAMWSNYLVTLFCMWVTAAVLAEVCSALPLSGSIYTWAAESAGDRFGGRLARLVGFVVAWWACTAWMTFVAGNCQTTANYIISLMVVYEYDFPGGVDMDNVKFRAFVWIVAEIFLIFAVALNHLPPHWYSRVFKLSLGVMMLDFFLCVIWLPIGASRSYGLRSTQDAFMMTYNGTGAPPAWNWILSFLFSAGTLTGFDAAGHIAEETKNASVIAARGLFTSAVATGVCGFLTMIVFLYCTPDFDTLFGLFAPQPFVQLYALALGNGGAVFMTVLATVGLVINTSIAIVAASRLVYAVARDGVLPLSSWIGRVTPNGQPRNAVWVIYIFGAVILCTILPSNVAFTSLVSAGGVPTIAAYGLIGLLRLTMTPGHFQGSKWYLGKWGPPMYLIVVLYQGLVFAVDISPFFYPVEPKFFNFAPAIFGAVTIFALISWWVIPESKWLRRAQIKRALAGADGAGSTEETPTGTDHAADQKHDVKVTE